MAHKAYVGNIPFSFTKADLENLFKPFGVVKSSDIILDRETGRSRGFGFVEMENAEQLAAAIEGMNGSLINGRPLTVNEARERDRTAGPPRGPGGFAPRPASDRPFADRAPRASDRPAQERPFGVGPSPRTAADRSPAGPDAAPPKRDRAPERGVDRRHPKMDGYEREHKDWRRYSDDDSWS